MRKLGPSWGDWCSCRILLGETFVPPKRSWHVQLFVFLRILECLVFQFWNAGIGRSILQILEQSLFVLSVFTIYTNSWRSILTFCPASVPKILRHLTTWPWVRPHRGRGERGESVWLSLNITALGVVPQVLRHPWILEMIKITSKKSNHQQCSEGEGRKDLPSLIWVLSGSLSVSS